MTNEMKNSNQLDTSALKEFRERAGLSKEQFIGLFQDRCQQNGVSTLRAPTLYEKMNPKHEGKTKQVHINVFAEVLDVSPQMITKGPKPNVMSIRCLRQESGQNLCMMAYLSASLHCEMSDEAEAKLHIIIDETTGPGSEALKTIIVGLETLINDYRRLISRDLEYNSITDDQFKADLINRRSRLPSNGSFMLIVLSIGEALNDLSKIGIGLWAKPQTKLLPYCQNFTADSLTLKVDIIPEANEGLDAYREVIRPSSGWMELGDQYPAFEKALAGPIATDVDDQYLKWFAENPAEALAWEQEQERNMPDEYYAEHAEAEWNMLPEEVKAEQKKALAETYSRSNEEKATGGDE
ncbi:MAG: hypothetical protein CML80_05695 [Rhodobiaceae bacterium]|nr:hypothetical protein [Rhodobiaceae bacterium]